MQRRMAISLLLSWAMLLSVEVSAQTFIPAPTFPAAPAPVPAPAPSGFSSPVALPASATGVPGEERIITTAAQLPPKGKMEEDNIDFVVNIELPGPEALFRRSSEKQFFEGIRQEARKQPGAPSVYFPAETPVTREPFVPRMWPRSVATVEPSYVCHGKLLFEQRNFERYGWDLGVLTPLVSVGKYYYDLALMPYHYFTDPCQHWDCSSGKCLPGDRVPLRLYPEKFSLTGLAAQGFVTTGLIIVFP